MPTKPTQPTKSSSEPTPRQTRIKTIPLAFTPGDPDESLGLLLTERDCPQAFSGALAHRFELNSRGDRVAGRLLIPASRSGPCPLVVIQPDAGASCNAASLEFAGSWVGVGFALATIDLPLHGERSSPKFSERLLTAIEDLRGPPASDPRLDANGESLLLEFTRQSVCDLSRTLDALATLPAIDDRRIGVMGVGHGAALTAIFASLDPRAKAIVLAHCSEIRLPEIDPVQFVADIGPRPVLLLEAARSAQRDSNTAIFDACAEPKNRSQSNDEYGQLGSAAAEAARAFFTDQLNPADS